MPLPLQGAMDSGATGHFLPESFNGGRHFPVTDGIIVGCANDSTMVSTATDIIPLTNLPQQAKHCDKFPDITTPLVSVPKLCGANLDVLFSGEQVTVTNKQGHTLLTGQQDPTTKLYMVPLSDQAIELQKGGQQHFGPPQAPFKPLHTAAGAYEVNTLENQINFYHASLGYPPISTLIKAIEKNYLTGWDGLTTQNIRKYCTKKSETSFGHMKKLRQHTKSTPGIIKTKRSKIHKIGVGAFPIGELQNLIATDLPGRLPITSARGHKYIFVMYDADTNYIKVIPIKSRKSSELVRALKICYEELKSYGFEAEILRLDNEISKELIATIKEEQLEYQLASPGDHRNNPAEKAIQNFKAHFISIREGTDDDFPTDGWDLLLPITELTMNLLRPSKINPRISAYTQLKGVFDYSKTPIAPPGCKIIIHDRYEERRSWARHGTPGFFINAAPDHYRNYECYIPSTKSTRFSNTVDFFPTTGKPLTTTSERLELILQDLLELLKDPNQGLPFKHHKGKLRLAVEAMQEIFSRPAPTLPSKGAENPTITAHRNTSKGACSKADNNKPSDVPSTQTQQVFKLGTIVRKRFNKGWFEGEVTAYDPKEQYYKITYKDGDTEELDYHEVKLHRKPSQQYARQSLLLKPYDSNFAYSLYPAVKTTRTQGLALGAGGAVWDEELNKMAQYRELIMHPNPTIQERWLTSGENEFGRLFQGFQKIEGIDVLEWIPNTLYRRTRK